MPAYLMVGCRRDSFGNPLVLAPRRTTGTLLRYLGHPNRFVSVQAASELRRRHMERPARVTTAIRKEPLTTRLRACRGTGSIDVRALTTVPQLLRALEGKDTQTRELAAWALGQHRDSLAIPGLTACLLDTDESVRASAARALGQIGPAASPATDALLARARAALTEYATCQSSINACHALAQIGADADLVVPLLIEMLGRLRRTDEEDIDCAIGGDSRLLIVRALELYGPAASSAVPALMSLLRRPHCHSDLLWPAIDSLAAIGPIPSEAIEALESLRRPAGTRLCAVATLVLEKRLGLTRPGGPAADTE